MTNPFEELGNRLDKIEKLLYKVLNQPTPSTPEQQDEIGGISLAEEITGLKRSTIYCHISAGKIPHFKRGGRVYFSRSALLEWLTQDTRGSPHLPLPLVLANKKNKFNKIKN